MKISIITVCYNSAKTLQDTFDSVKSQTYTDIEYIVVDGASTDGTLEMIQEHEAHISKWVSEPDKGLYDAMNKGIEMATGNLIGILNSDDVFMDSEVISKIAAFHWEHPEISASTGNIIQKNEQGVTVRTYGSKNWKPEKLKIGFMPPHPSIFLKKEVYDEFGVFKTDFKIGADYEIVTRFFLKNSISWKYSGITTTSMLIGGVSSSGISSYLTISKEIQKALLANGISFSALKIYLRGFWKVWELVKK